MFGYNFGGKEGRFDESNNDEGFAELTRAKGFDADFFRCGKNCRQGEIPKLLPLDNSLPRNCGEVSTRAICQPLP
jgi:hypothetical protein